MSTAISTTFLQTRLWYSSISEHEQHLDPERSVCDVDIQCRKFLPRQAKQMHADNSHLQAMTIFRFHLLLLCYQPSVLWHCWLGVRKSIRPVKIEWWGVGVVICLERGADCLHMVQLMSLHPKTPSSLASFKSRVVLSFLYRLTQAVLKEAVKSINQSINQGFFIVA